MNVPEGFELKIELELLTMVTPHFSKFLAHYRPEDKNKNKIFQLL